MTHRLTPELVAIELAMQHWKLVGEFLPYHSGLRSLFDSIADADALMEIINHADDLLNDGDNP